MGSSAAFILAFLAASRRGAIAVTRPGYPAYLNTLIGLGFGPVEIPVTRRQRLAADGGGHRGGPCRRKPFDGTAVRQSPANPTGAAVDRAGLARDRRRCAQLGVRLISDEIYHGLDYRGPSVSALELTGDAIIINSFSKYYCMTGWRIGWMVLPDELVRRAEMLQQNLFISAPTLSQVAARVALGERDYSEEQKAALCGEPPRLAGGWPPAWAAGERADGAFYAYADVGRFTNNSLELLQAMLDEAGVAATPGIDFDRVNGNRFVRFSYAGPQADDREAIERLGGFVDSL